MDTDPSNRISRQSVVLGKLEPILSAGSGAVASLSGPRTRNKIKGRDEPRVSVPVSKPRWLPQEQAAANGFPPFIQAPMQLLICDMSEQEAHCHPHGHGGMLYIVRPRENRANRRRTGSTEQSGNTVFSFGRELVEFPFGEIIGAKATLVILGRVGSRLACVTRQTLVRWSSPGRKPCDFGSLVFVCR
ncbi:hypothetical protein V2G26_008410 [Clonostachys chloroleuca]